jgi:hypothetical protein
MNAFDVCWDVYRACAEQSAGGRIGAVDASVFKEHKWRPETKPRFEDFMADFARAGAAALGGKKMASRRVLFDVYVAGGAPWDRACWHLGICEFTGARWMEEIKHLVGAELVKRGIFPPKEYFREFRR